MNKVGMYGGKFLPLHNGHVRCIVEASTMVDKLYVILNYDEENEKRYFEGLNMKPISYKERYKWLYQLTKDMPNVKVISLPEIWDVNKYKSRTYSWHKNASMIKQKVFQDCEQYIDMVFFGGDYKESFWQELYPNAAMHKFNRCEEDISATKIRHEGAFKHWNSIPNVVKPYFVKKICIVGTESTGKTTLVNNLANYYNTNQVKEYGRDVCEEAGGAENIQVKDYKKILCGQIILEEEAIKNSNKVLFVDSEQMVTSYYLNLYNREDNDWELEHTKRLSRSLSMLQEYDLILNMAPNVPWVDDGTRLHGDKNIRFENDKTLRELYNLYDIDYITISASEYDIRFKQAVRLINDIILGE